MCVSYPTIHLSDTLTPMFWYLEMGPLESKQGWMWPWRGSPLDGISPIWKETPENLPLPALPSPTCMHQEKAMWEHGEEATYMPREPSQGTNPTNTLILDLQFGTEIKKHLLVKPPVYGVFLQQPELRQICQFRLQNLRGKQVFFGLPMSCIN